MDITQNSKRIAKNTIILYFRMIVTTLISLYTSRILLNMLELEDFGIYSVVAGLIEFAGIFTGTLTSATQRFLSFALGKKDLKAFNKSFYSLCNIFFLFCFIILIFFIIFGLWMVYNVLDIPDGRKYAASWVLICSVLSFILSTLAIPYTSALIAYEKMNVFAYISIADAIFKLLATISLFMNCGDLLIFYAVVMLIFRGILNLGIYLYCKTRLQGCVYHFSMDWGHIKQLAAYSGWTLIGSTSYVLMTQGHSILLNVFFGPIVNAAKGIADRVKNFAMIFSQNVLLAISPALTKSYAEGEIKYLCEMLMVSSRLSFMLLLLVSAPLIIEMESVLQLWLGAENVTPDAILFSVNSILFVLISTIEAPLTKVVQASGNVKSYEIIVGSTTLLFIPISYLILMLGHSATSTYIIMNIIYLAIIIYRVYRVRQIIHFSYGNYFCKVIVPILSTILCFCLFVYIIQQTPIVDSNLFLRLAIWFFIILILAAFIGLSPSERIFMYHKIRMLKR